MKLLINKRMRIDFQYPPSLAEMDEESVSWPEFFSDLKDVAKKFGLWGTFDIRDDRVLFEIAEQKVYLDDVAMHELFCDFFTYLFEFDIQYVELGGAGCEFTIEIENARPLKDYKQAE